MIPWWLRPTKAGRFYARHKRCKFSHHGPLGVRGGWVTYVKCENVYCYLWPDRLYEDTGYPLVPPWTVK